MSRNPWYQSWLDDWKQDNIRILPLALKGLLGEMERLAVNGKPYGHVTWPDGRAVTVTELAMLASETAEVVANGISDLQSRDAIGATKDGAYIIPHLVKRNALSKKRAKSGKIGASVTNSKTTESDGLPQQKPGKRRAPETKNQKPKEGSPPKGGPPPPKQYHFLGKIVRLTLPHWQRLRDEHGLTDDELEEYMDGRDEWASKLPEADSRRKQWWHPMVNDLKAKAEGIRNSRQ